jgi:Antitoxin VbhA
MAAEAISPEEHAERAHRVDEAIHGGEMEGLHVTEATRADADEYVAGRIGSDELVERARTRYGLTDLP